MRNTLVPVLLLATVALSSSNILPIVSMRDKPDLRYGQSNDNIFSSKHDSSDDTNSMLYKIDLDNQRPDRKLFDNDYANPNNIYTEETHPPNNDIYDVKGFRKEQWHNYPRQLDRLNKYLYEHFNSDQRNLLPDDPEFRDDGPQNDIPSNEIHLDDSFDPHKSIDEADKAAAIMSPLIVLKIHLACLNRDVELSKFPGRALGSELNQLEQNENEDYASNLSYDNPKSNAGKVKREGKTKFESVESTQDEPKNRMSKRIFSLWSRLQSLNHKGHELHHRRHLYALYGMPDSEGGGGGGVLTAETRATFMRPPGSPLRWG